jgi:hypothetical protein
VNNERRVIPWRPIAGLAAAIAMVLATLWYEPGEVSWQVNAEMVVLLAGTLLAVYSIRRLRRPPGRSEDPAGR